MKRSLTKTYNKCIKLKTYAERLAYLRLPAGVGEETFGQARALNQDFYHSYEWRKTRDFIISRDFGRDMALEGFEIHGKIIVHHINPITIQDILDGAEAFLLNPSNLICVSPSTHDAIHFRKDVLESYVERTPNDTIPWR